MKRKTNSEFITDLMEIGNPLKQMIIITAITNYAKEILMHEEKPDAWPEMISWEAWKACCKEIQDKMDEHFS